MNEQFSALVDGELDGKEGDALLARLKADTELQDGWDHYHLIGDALRQNRQLDIDITAAVRAPGRRTHRAGAGRLAAPGQPRPPRLALGGLRHGRQRRAGGGDCWRAVG